MSFQSNHESRCEAANCKLAKKLWGRDVDRFLLQTMAELIRSFHFSLRLGDLLLLHRNWYVTHTGLLRLARRNHCAGIHVRPVSEFCSASAQQWAFEATVYKTQKCRGFVGYGDASPFNVSPLVHGAEMRVAETRAVNRALRKAYGIGICSVEELGSLGETSQTAREVKKLPPQPVNGNGFGGPRVRDRLCQVIRQHQLDPTLVKAYATDFCGVKALREASREQLESFLVHLADWADKDRNALVCQLNSYLTQKESVA